MHVTHSDGLFSKLREEVRFLKSWAGKPLTTGAVAPSGRDLARLMAAQVEPGRSGRILELGPGTGVVTEALLGRGIHADRIVSVEYNADFVRLMHERFPGVTVVRGDAYALSADPAIGTDQPLASIVSSLPLLSRPGPDRRALIMRALEMLEPGAPFIQFSYGLLPPVRADDGSFTVEKSRWVWRNIPPARVWIYRRKTH